MYKISPGYCIMYSISTIMTAVIFITYATIFISEYRSEILIIDINRSADYKINVRPCEYLSHEIDNLNATICATSYTLYDNVCIYDNDFCHDNSQTDPKPSNYYELKIIASDFTDNPVIYSMIVFSMFIILLCVSFGIIEFRNCCNEYEDNNECDCIEIIRTIVYCLLIIIFNALTITAIWMIPIVSTYQSLKYCDVVCNNEYYVETGVNYYIYNTCCIDSQINFDHKYIPDDTIDAINVILYSLLSMPMFINLVTVFSSLLPCTQTD